MPRQRLPERAFQIRKLEVGGNAELVCQTQGGPPGEIGVRHDDRRGMEEIQTTALQILLQLLA